MKRHGWSRWRGDLRRMVSFSFVWFLVLALVFTPTVTAFAELPQGGVTYESDVQIQYSGDGNGLTIAQHSDRAVIDWTSFSIGEGKTVDFRMHGDDFAVLNRVLGHDPSKILGRLESNGTVLLVNPSGIVFGQNATVDVGSLIASTLSLDEAAFKTGDYVFDAQGSSGTIENHADVTVADAGAIFLLGSQVVNRGHLTAQGGTVGLLAGDKIVLTSLSSGAPNVVIEQGALDALIQNSQGATLEGGHVILSAEATQALSRHVINQDGMIRALKMEPAAGPSGTFGLGGRIVISGGHTGGVRVAGQLDASGTDADPAAGYIEVTGTHLTIANDLVFDASDGMVMSATGLFATANSDNDVDGDIVIEGIITNRGDGNLTLRADAEGIGRGQVVFNNGGAIDLRGSAGNVDVFYNTSDYRTPTDYSRHTTLGSGRLTAYMLVNNVHDLQNISLNLAGAYALGRDIDATATHSWNGEAGFKPLGAGFSGFTGILDGQGHNIQQLYVRAAASNYAALFGTIEAEGVVRNLGLTDVSVGVGPLNQFMFGAGALAGENFGTISHVHSTGVVRSENASDTGGLVGQNHGTMIASYSLAKVFGRDEVGGLVGTNRGHIAQSYSDGEVEGRERVGGLVGHNVGTIRQAFSSGQVQGNNMVGGLVGSNWTHTAISGYEPAQWPHEFGEIAESYSTAKVNWDEDNSQPLQCDACTFIGGLVGSNTSPHNGEFGTVERSYWDIEQSGQTTSDGGTGITTGELQSADFWEKSGWDIDTVGGQSAVWRMYDGQSGPLLKAFFKVDEEGVRLVVVEVGDNALDYGHLTADHDFKVRYYFYDDMTAADASDVDELHFTIVDKDGREVDPADWQYLTVGEYFLKVAGDSSRYQLRFVPGTVNVVPRDLRIQIGDLERMFGDDNDLSHVNLEAVHFPYLPNPSSLAPGHTLADLGITDSAAYEAYLHTTAGRLSDVGDYAIGMDEGIALSELASNYNISFVSGTLKITPRPLTITAADVTRQYLDILGVEREMYRYSSPVGLVDGAGLPQAGFAGWNGNRHAEMVVAEYPIAPYVVDGDPHAGNYDITLEKGTLTIVPRDIQVTAPDAQRVYGDTVRSWGTATVTNIPDGFAIPEFQYEDVTNARHSVGLSTGAITAAVDNPNYTITELTPGSIQITPAELVIEVVGAQKTYGDGSGGITLTDVVYHGLKSWDDDRGLVGHVDIVSDGANNRANAGLYGFTPVGTPDILNGNYAFAGFRTSDAARLTVLRRDLFPYLGDVEYYANEPVPLPKIEFHNRASFDSDAALAERGSFGRVTYNETLHWRWNPHVARPGAGSLLDNYNVVYDNPAMQYGRHIIHPALDLDDIIDHIITNPRDREWQRDPTPPARARRPPRTVVIDNCTTVDGKVVCSDPPENPLTIIFFDDEPIHLDFSGGESVITIGDEDREFYNLGDGDVPPKCLVSRGGEQSVDLVCVRTGGEMMWEPFNYTAGVPNEAREVMGQALGQYLKDLGKLNAANFEEAWLMLERGDDAFLAEVFPYLVNELHNILNKPSPDMLTPAEQAYLDHMAEFIQRQRRQAAEDAQRLLDEWDAMQEEIKDGRPPLLNMYTLNQPAPDWIKDIANSRYPQQDGNTNEFLMRAITSLGAAAGGAAIGAGAGYGAGLSGLASYVFPFASRAGSLITNAVASGAGALAAAAGAVAQIVIASIDVGKDASVRNAVRDAWRDAEEPPSFWDMKEMLSSEEGQAQLLMYQGSALGQYRPGGIVEGVSKYGEAYYRMHPTFGQLQ